MDTVWLDRRPSRRTSGYHAWAAVLSNGIWFGSQFILIGTFVQVIRDADLIGGVIAAVVYTAGTMTGSLGMHWIALNKSEKGKRAS